MTIAQTPTSAKKRRAALTAPGRASLDRRLLCYAAAPALALAAPAVAAADFSGPYDVSNWAITPVNSDPTVDTSGAPASVIITGPNNGTNLPGTLDFTIAVVGSGTWSFHWEYTSVDTDGFDNGAWLLNDGAPVLLAQNSDSPASGNESIPVVAGNIIGWRVESKDNLLGPGILTISNFSAPEAAGEVPAPSTLALLALGASGVALARLRKTRPPSE